MLVNLRIILVAVACSLPSTILHAQVDQASLAQILRSGSALERGKAVQQVYTIAPTDVGVELRAALYAALEREGQLHAQNYQERSAGRALVAVEVPELLFRLAEAVVRLRDPESIPALVAALPGGSVARALADFGESAAPAILRVVGQPNGWYDAVNEGLIALRFMVELREAQPLSPETLAAIKRAAGLHLSQPAHPGAAGTTVRWAIDLAVILGDSDLRVVVEKLASNSSEVFRRGITDPHLVAITQRRAAERLAGIPPLPRP